MLDFIAITDHNETSFARALQTQLGSQIIVGEEIKTFDGEIIGLYLTRTIEKGKSALDTVREIHAQGGLVYIPHPFETGRAGLQENILERIKDEIDILEVFNARGRFRGKNDQAASFSKNKNFVLASSSDSHCLKGVGSAYSIVDQEPTKESLVDLLKTAELRKEYAPLISFLCPSINKIKNKLFL